MKTPASLGYRWPAEWEPHSATWLSWPWNPDTWPGRLEKIFPSYVAMVHALHVSETVCINVRDEATEDQARGLLAAGGVELDRIRFHPVATNDTWVRDHGPIFVVREVEGRREKAILDFEFDCWGKKYEPFDLDNAVPSELAQILDLPRFVPGIVLEGGSIDGNGCGSVLTTESCLLNSNRGAGRSREAMEKVLAENLGVSHVLWLEAGIAGDDTDGHVDDIARFVAAGTVVTAISEDPNSDNAAVLIKNRNRLKGMCDQAGKPLSVVELPMPADLSIAGLRCPASYANFYLANGVALVPVFEVSSDARALAILRELLPGREVVGIPARDLVYGLGAIHCMTQQEPTIGETSD